MMIMKKSVLLFISLFPLSVLANPASSNDLDSSLIRQVSVDTPYIDAKLPKGAEYIKIKSNILSLNIPNGLSVDAYPLTDFRGDVVKYAPGQYPDLINIQSIKVTEEYVESVAPLVITLTTNFESPATTCLDVRYLNWAVSSTQGELDLGKICTDKPTDVMKTLPEGLKEGDRYTLYFYDLGGSGPNSMKGMGDFTLTEAGMKLQSYEALGRSTGTQDKIGTLNIRLNYRNPWG